MKDKLPDAGSEYEGPENGDVTDAIDFILMQSKFFIRATHKIRPEISSI